MTPDELLRRYPRETLRFLRRRLGMCQLYFGPDLGISPKTLGSWGARRHRISEECRARSAALLAPCTGR